MIFAIIATALAAPLTPPLFAAPRIEVANGIVRVGDVVDLLAIPTARRPGFFRRVIARLPSDRTPVTMSRAALMLLVHRAVPALAPSAGGRGPVTLYTRRSSDAALRRDCMMTTAAVAQGVALTADVVGPIACRNGGSAAALFDRQANVARATRDLAVGAYLGRIMVSGAPLIRKGASLNLVSTVGPVRIDRVVTALQDGRGKRVFVRDQDGHVFAARLESSVEGPAK
ncbi:hypothetical protein G4G27_02025 [Sphingomonas sp. So64.6b]|uniref:hypothetical protein n=1 Tax=Sphingomonas sp. So64.6b TaxID=2997354 RepID=UPI0016003ABD|nr:hypothetical protein [Sphingomonas sp. So64.6b]QNA82923.1 hypothetical protein G4G27_02025 [Sphingomonas sp. So64.6b]